MLKGDYGTFVGEETLGCRIQGYLLYAFLSGVMNAFALQVSYFIFFSNELTEKIVFCFC